MVLSCYLMQCRSSLVTKPWQNHAALQCCNRVGANAQQVKEFPKNAQVPADLRFVHPDGLNRCLVAESTCVIQKVHLGMRVQIVRENTGFNDGDGTGANR